MLRKKLLWFISPDNALLLTPGQTNKFLGIGHLEVDITISSRASSTIDHCALSSCAWVQASAAHDSFKVSGFPRKSFYKTADNAESPHTLHLLVGQGKLKMMLRFQSLWTSFFIIIALASVECRRSTSERGGDQDRTSTTEPSERGKFPWISNEPQNRTNFFENVDVKICHKKRKKKI